MNLSKDILLRFFSGNYSAKDYIRVHEQFSGGEGEHLQELLEEHWMEGDIGEAERKETDPILHQLQHRIFLEENTRQVRIKPFVRLQRIAALLFVPLLLSFLFYLFLDQKQAATDAYAEIISPLSGKTHFVLPDGSTGYLNNGSVLRYPVRFNRNREVRLSGEACFDVVHNGSPFHVLTPTLDIRVTGTVFNVTAWKDEQTEEVILESGEVHVATAQGKELAVLKPDQQLVVAKGSADFSLLPVDASQFTAWTEGKLIFRNENLDRVVNRLNRWYNAEIKIQDPELNAFTFHATFMDEPLDQVLKLLSLTTPISYTETERSLTPGGQPVEHRKIILKLDKEKVNMFR